MLDEEFPHVFWYSSADTRCMRRERFFFFDIVPSCSFQTFLIATRICIWTYCTWYRMVPFCTSFKTCIYVSHRLKIESLLLPIFLCCIFYHWCPNIECSRPWSSRKLRHHGRELLVEMGLWGGQGSMSATTLYVLNTVTKVIYHTSLLIDCVILLLVSRCTTPGT